jgi:hypothetical protein
MFPPAGVLTGLWLVGEAAWEEGKDSSFSEEKEAKRLLHALRGCARRWGASSRQPEKSLFASFSSEKEESCFWM